MESQFTSRRDPDLTATVVRKVPMVYADGADPSLDRPAHVRAASGVRWFGKRLAVVQDDANFIALVHPSSGIADSIVLPAGPDGQRQFDDTRGNKAFKFDFEACFYREDRFIALGSGSAPAREVIFEMHPDGSYVIHKVPEFYAKLHAAKAFSGSELNLEGSVYMDGWVRLFNRGNGATRDGLKPVNAFCDVYWAEIEVWLRNRSKIPVPDIHLITPYHLGEIEGAPLTFTDGTLDGKDLVYVAAAEDAPDALTDGIVTGSAIGVLRDNEALWIELREPDGQLFRQKIEGICPAHKGKMRYLGVVDADDPDKPSLLVTIQCYGKWQPEKPIIAAALE